VSLNSALTYLPRLSADRYVAPHGSAALAICACATLCSTIGAPSPVKKTLGMRKYRAATATCPARSASDHPLITLTTATGTPGDPFGEAPPKLRCDDTPVEPQPGSTTANAATTTSSFRGTVPARDIQR